MSTLERLNFFLAVLVSLAYCALAAYCAYHGTPCWAALGFAAFFGLFAWVLASRPRQS